MRQRIDLDGLFADAVDQLPDWMDGHVPPLRLSVACAFTLDELLRR